MKTQKVAALMLSMALTFSTCMPLNGITAWGAETGNTTVEASEQEEVSDSAEGTEIQQEEDLSSETETVETTTPEEEIAPEEDESADDRKESTDETEAADTQQEEETAAESESSSDEEYKSAAPAQKKDSSKGEERSMSGTKNNSAVEQSTDTSEENDSEDYNDYSDGVNQELHVWPDGGEEGYCLTISAEQGESFELKVNTNADDPNLLSYTWYLNDEEIEGNNSDTLITDPAMAEQSYYCMVQDQYGNSAQASFIVYVENHLNVWIDGESEGTDFAYLFAALGESVELKVNVSADDAESISYQWYLDNGGEYQEIEGNNSDTLITDPVTGYHKYHCDVQDKYGNTVGATFNISVDNHLKAWPEGENEESNTANIAVSYGETAEMKVNVSADDESSLSYTWYRDWDYIEAENTDTLTCDPVTEKHTYQCTVQDQYGNTYYVYFEVSVENHLKAWVDGQDEDTQGISYQVTPGESRELKVNVSAEDESVLSYTWYMNGEEIEGNNTDSLTTESITGYQEYKCDVSDQYGNTISVWFYISPENNLQAWPDGEDEWTGEKQIYLPFGETAELKVNVSAPEGSTLSYFWYLNGEEIEGNNSTTLITEPVTEYGYYYFEVRDQYDNIASVYFHVYVENNLNAYVKGEDEDIQDISIGTPAKKPVDLEVVVDADDDSSLTYTWYLNDEEIEGANELVLHTDPIVESRNYKFRVQDQYGNEVSVYFYVYVENNLNAYPEGEDEDSIYKQYAVEYNESKDLKVIVTADDTSALSYTWYVSGEEIEGNNSDTLTTGPITENKGYEFVVRDQYGTERRVTFYVYIDNGLNAYPEGYDPDEDSISVPVPLDGTAELKVAVSAKDKSQLTYQWFVDYNQVEEADSDTFKTDPINTHEWIYVVVSDQYGNSDSTYFYVYVENHLTAYPEGEAEDATEKNIYVPEGESAVLKAVVSADDESGLTYEWYDWSSESYQYTEEASLTTSPIHYHRTFELDVTDKYGNTKTLHFYIYVENHLKAYPKGEDVGTDSTDVYVASGQPAELEACVTADKMEDINYQWYIQETDSDGYKWFDELEGETDLSLKTEPITKEQVYRLQVEDYYGDRRNVVFNVFPQAVSGWVEEGGERYYYKDDGTKLTNGWAKDGSAWYWMDSSGKITKNQWVQSGGKWYYMNANGVMVTGWQQIGGKWYYMNSSGAMTTGWQQIGGKWYYMNSSGAMTTGWQQIGGKWYYMNSSGVMTTGWQQIGGKWYYMNSSGQMVTGTQVIGGKTYVFNSSGVWIK